MWGAYFCMGAYKRDVVVVIKGCLFCVGAYYPDFTVQQYTTVYYSIYYWTLNATICTLLMITILQYIVQFPHSWYRICGYTLHKKPRYNIYTLLHELACNIASYCTSGHGIFTSRRRVKMQSTSAITAICTLTSVIKCLLSITSTVSCLNSHKQPSNSLFESQRMHRF